MYVGQWAFCVMQYIYLNHCILDIYMHHGNFASFKLPVCSGLDIV